MKNVYQNKVQGRLIEPSVPVWIGAMGLEWLYQILVKLLVKLLVKREEFKS